MDDLMPESKTDVCMWVKFWCPRKGGLQFATKHDKIMYFVVRLGLESRPPRLNYSNIGKQDVMFSTAFSNDQPSRSRIDRHRHNFISSVGTH